MARRLFDRLPPSRWTLEWHLPLWLGDALRVDPDASRAIVLSNVLGLGSIRLQDDLADGEVAPQATEAAGQLAAALYDAALEPYRAWFPPASPFWAHLERCMRAWRSATDATGGEEHLAARGAPLKVSAFALCLLADRLVTFRALEPCLDRALEALVRYDHADPRRPAAGAERVRGRRPSERRPGSAPHTVERCSSR
jgi:hypothetical protein